MVVYSQGSNGDGYGWYRYGLAALKTPEEMGRLLDFRLDFSWSLVSYGKTSLLDDGLRLFMDPDPGPGASFCMTLFPC